MEHYVGLDVSLKKTAICIVDRFGKITCEATVASDRSSGDRWIRTALAMVFKLVETAQRSWRRLDGHSRLPKLIVGVKFVEGLEVAAKPVRRQPATAA